VKVIGVFGPLQLTWDSFLLPIMDSRSWLTIWLVPHGVAARRQIPDLSA